jgi:hypothetical protein
MKSSFKVILSAAAVAAIVVMAAPAVNAQCAPAQIFGSTGLNKAGMVQVELAGPVSGHEVGSFWNAANSGTANNFGGTCPASLWMAPRTASGNRGISGGIGQSPCFANTCPTPNDQMMFLVEDYGPGGPPGVGGTAYFTGFRMDSTPGAARYWDLARAAGNTAQVLPQLSYPDATVQTSARNEPNVDTTQAYANIGLNFYGETAGGPLLDSMSILSFDICTFHGPGDPGRDRSSWSCSATVPYADAAVANVPVSVPCPNDGDDTYVAIGATFAGDVPSRLVGKATAMECDPNLADPDADLNRRPTVRPKKRGGR